jgi:hypothetical protein
MDPGRLAARGDPDTGGLQGLSLGGLDPAGEQRLGLPGRTMILYKGQPAQRIEILLPKNE